MLNMKNTLTIATFNFQNTYHPYQTLEDKTNCYSFIKFIMENDIDILGTQETTTRKLRLCEPILTDYGYKIYGNGRFGKLGHIFPIKLADETNSIIFKQSLGKGIHTTKLPWRGTVFPRIITRADFADIVFLNTHLDNLNPKVKAKQLLFIKQVIKQLVSEGKKIILTGDFNMTLKNKNLREFIQSLNLIGIKRVDANENSYREINFGPLDHIFIPKEWKVESISQPQLSISDHKPIIVKVKTN